MSLIKGIESANAEYSDKFTKGDLSLPPAKKAVIIHCMDARIDPSTSLGFQEGDVHVIRNAGGRASDALRSVIISQRLLGTREIIILHHTDCGMLTFTDDKLRNILKEETGQSVDHISFLPFGDLKQSVLDDVKFLQDNPLVLDVPITGYIYDVKTGKIHKVDR
ncbi:hypothetical protein CAAN1_02S09164 [[Candida] anglica]|uniref:Carbonic anhydrase n=1 Tax=[Candida] anglica TaxID=148631 RepID=A0ABP0EBT8_9ASCO